MKEVLREIGEVPPTEDKTVTWEQHVGAAERPRQKPWSSVDRKKISDFINPTTGVGNSSFGREEAISLFAQKTHGHGLEDLSINNIGSLRVVTDWAYDPETGKITVTYYNVSRLLVGSASGPFTELKTTALEDCP